MGKKERKLLSERPSFEGQVDSMVMDLDQITAISSAACTDVFACLSDTEATSIREIASELQKSTATVGTHMATLLKANLVLAVGTRKRRSRTETLYATSAKKYQIILLGQSWEFYEQYLTGYRSILRSMDRRNTEQKITAFADPDFMPFGRNLGRAIWLDRADIERLNAAMSELHEVLLRIDQTDPEKQKSDDCIRVHVHTAFFPAVAESRAWRARKSKKDPT